MSDLLHQEVTLVPEPVRRWWNSGWREHPAIYWAGVTSLCLLPFFWVLLGVSMQLRSAERAYILPQTPEAFPLMHELYAALFPGYSLKGLAVLMGLGLAVAGGALLLRYTMYSLLPAAAVVAGVLVTGEAIVRWIPQQLGSPTSPQDFTGYVLAVAGVSTVFLVWHYLRSGERVRKRLPLLISCIAEFAVLGLAVLLLARDFNSVPHIWGFDLLLAGGAGLPIATAAALSAVLGFRYLEELSGSSTRGRRFASTIVQFTLAALVIALALSVPVTGGNFQHPTVSSTSYQAVATSSLSPGRLRVVQVSPRTINSVQSGSRRELPSISATLPNFIAVKDALLEDRYELLKQLRPEDQRITDTIFSLVAAVIFTHHPLSDEQIEDWYRRVLNSPSSFREDLALLQNLIASGRKQKAEAMLAHMKSNLERTPRVSDLQSFFPLQVEDSSELNYFSYKLQLLESELGRLDPPDDTPRSLRVRVEKAGGSPVQGAAVGIHQTKGLRASQNSPSPKSVQLQREELGGRELEFSESHQARFGRFQKTDQNGEAVFTGLRPADYGVSGLTSNSLSTIPLNRIAVLDDPLPDPLPRGETTVTLRLIPLGTYALNQDGELEFQPNPSREELLMSSSSVDSREPPEQIRAGQAEKLRRRLLGSHSTWDDPVVIQRGQEGKPEAVWMRKNTMSSLPGYTAPQVGLDK